MVLLRAQWSALLYTREGYVLPLSLCRADASSSTSVALRASPAHGLSPLEGKKSFGEDEWCRGMTSREALPSAGLSSMGSPSSKDGSPPEVFGPATSCPS